MMTTKLRTKAPKKKKKKIVPKTKNSRCMTWKAGRLCLCLVCVRRLLLQIFTVHNTRCCFEFKAVYQSAFTFLNAIVTCIMCTLKTFDAIDNGEASFRLLFHLVRHVVQNNITLRPQLSLAILQPLHTIKLEISP